MAKIYANLIISGDKTFANVPAKLQDQVGEILVKLGKGDLCD